MPIPESLLRASREHVGEAENEVVRLEMHLTRHLQAGLSTVGIEYSLQMAEAALKRFRDHLFELEKQERSDPNAAPSSWSGRFR